MVIEWWMIGLIGVLAVVWAILERRALINVIRDLFR